MMTTSCFDGTADVCGSVPVGAASRDDRQDLSFRTDSTEVARSIEVV
jgi:hypothetical protein